MSKELYGATSTEHLKKLLSNLRWLYDVNEDIDKRVDMLDQMQELKEVIEARENEH